MDTNDVTPELKERAKACKTDEELDALSKSEGAELTVEQLDAVVGGARRKTTLAAVPVT